MSCRQITRRPQWPYESWDTDSEFDLHDVEANNAGQETVSDLEIEDVGKRQNDGNCGTNQSEEQFGPDHWDEMFDNDVPEDCPINKLLMTIDSEDVTETPEASEICKDITEMMEKSLSYLCARYEIFDKGYLLPVGSMAENTKIRKADEFDFAVILPRIADTNCFYLLLREESAFSDPDIIGLVMEIADNEQSDINEILMNLQAHLKIMWSSAMSVNITKGWIILDTKCYLDDISIAGTFHVQRKHDNYLVDLDVCFWVPLDAKNLKAAPDSLEQRDFLLKHALDDCGLVYAILPRDNTICLSINTVRFAMSRLERQALHQFGTENGRLKCYKLCKCIVSSLVPKFKKRKTCSYCFESVISSFCLKNIILYMMSFYKDDHQWSKSQLPNRLVEVFGILSHCMRVNCQEISAFFSPYVIGINNIKQYDPTTSCVVSKPRVLGVDESEEAELEEKPCAIPDLEPIISQIDDAPSQKILSKYANCLTCFEWSFMDIICRLDEILKGLRIEDPGKRSEMAEELVWHADDCLKFMPNVFALNDDS